VPVEINVEVDSHRSGQLHGGEREFNAHTRAQTWRGGSPTDKPARGVRACDAGSQAKSRRLLQIGDAQSRTKDLTHGTG